jgi:general secretion pathway protein K
MTVKGKGERGLALISVLWGLSLLSVIATLALSSSVSNRRIEVNQFKEIRARTIAEAAIIRAALGLTDSRSDQRWRVDGVAQTFTFDGLPVSVAVQDELGKIDLNTARDDVLRGLFHAVVPNQDLADALTDRVLDWRAPGMQKHLNGATTADYDSAGSAFVPRGAAFQSVDELNFVLGMTPEIFARVVSALTVYSSRPTLDPNTAPVLALQAAGQPEQVAGNIVSSRGTGRAGQGTLDPGMGLGGRAFTITVSVTLDGRVYVNEAVIRLTGDPARPYWILAWDGRPAPAPAS